MENEQVIEEVNCMRLYLIYMNERDSPGRFVKKNSEKAEEEEEESPKLTIKKKNKV